MGAQREFTKSQAANRNAPQSLDFVANTRKQAADLTIATFFENDLQHRVVFAARFNSGTDNLCQTLREVNTALECFQVRTCRMTDDLNKIRLLHPVARMGQAIGEVAIVRNQDQSLAGFVEAADVVNTLVGFDQIDDPQTAGWVAAGGNNTRRFVDGKVLQTLQFDRSSIDTDLALGRIDLGT